MSATPRLSSPLNGSSSIKKSGSSMIAWAIPSLCRIPREYFATGFFRSGSSPTRCNTRRISPAEIFRFRSARISRFFFPVYSVRNPGVSMISPRLSGKSVSLPIYFSPTQILPDVTGRKPQMHFISTVFPEPLFPTIPYTFPLLMAIVVSFSTTSLPNFFVTLSTLT